MARASAPWPDRRCSPTRRARTDLLGALGGVAGRRDRRAWTRGERGQPQRPGGPRDPCTVGAAQRGRIAVAAGGELRPRIVRLRRGVVLPSRPRAPVRRDQAEQLPTADLGSCTLTEAATAADQLKRGTHVRSGRDPVAGRPRAARPAGGGRPRRGGAGRPHRAPALLGGLDANAADPAGAASLAEALGQHDPALVEGGVDLAQVDPAEGEKIAQHIFGDNRTRWSASSVASAGPPARGSSPS